MDNSDLLGPGRPQGGLAILWNRQLSYNIRYLGCSPNNRVMAILLEIEHGAICIFNVYMPCFNNNI